MAERPEDLNLPNAVVTRIIKDAIPDGVAVSKEARLAISKAASVFVLYATSCSNNFALKGKRKTITAQDVLSAMEDMEFEQFIEPLQQCQEAYRQEKKDKASKQKEKAILSTVGEEPMTVPDDADSPSSPSTNPTTGSEPTVVIENGESSGSEPEVIEDGGD